MGMWQVGCWLCLRWGAPQAVGKTGRQILNENVKDKAYVFFLVVMSDNVTGRACCCVRATAIADV